MFNYPTTPKRKTAPQTLFGSPNKTIRSKKGLFVEGVWTCNCTPRLPAPIFQVRKDGPNKSRWFYTCQFPQKTNCGFFLWKDEAQTREKEAVMGNARSEIEVEDEDDEVEWKSPSPTPTLEESPTRRLSKEKMGANDNEYGDELSVSEEGDAVRLMDNIPHVQPVTPRKAAATTEDFATPATRTKRKRGADEEPRTPMTKSNTARDIFRTPSTTRLEGGMWDGNERLGLRTPSVTPTTGRFYSPNLGSAYADSTMSTPMKTRPQTPSHKRDDITRDVLRLVTPLLDDDVLEELKGVLEKHELKVAGFVKGRDISRAALKKKEVEIAELKGRIVGLERDKEVDRLVVGRARPLGRA